MKKAFAGAMITALALMGCEKKSEEGGGAGSDTFRLAVPRMATGITQGETQTVRVTVERGDGFKQRVKLEMTAPDGIQLEPGDVTVEPGDKGDVQVKITAAEDAAIGEHKIMVKGTPDRGESTTAEFRVTVSAE